VGDYDGVVTPGGWRSGFSASLHGSQGQQRKVFMASPSRRSEKSPGTSKVASKSPIKSGADDLAAGISAWLGDLLLTDK
jgi:hypothetical protein